MAEIIAKLNEVFGEDTTNEDQLVYVNHVLMGKLMESETLRQQAANNSKEQFGTSPDLRTQVVNAAMDAQDAHMNMSNKLLNSPEVLNGVLDILAEPFETLGGVARFCRTSTEPEVVARRRWPRTRFASLAGQERSKGT